MNAFTIHNLPYGVISTQDNPTRRCAVAFESSAIDLDMLFRDGFFTSIPDLSVNVFATVSIKDALKGLYQSHANQGSWNAFAILSRNSRALVRDRIRHGILSNAVETAMVPLAKVQCHLPMRTQNFSDFFCSLEHTRNVRLTFMFCF